MTFQEWMIAETKDAATKAFTYANATLPERVAWKPEPTSRSVLDLSQEMAQCASWSRDILLGVPWSMLTDEEKHANLSTVKDCELYCLRELESFYDAIRTFPDERLEEVYHLDWGDGGMPITMRENIKYPRWNFNYHEGQIAYIQTLYGDHALHSF
jgi:hypothetical protein